MQDLLETLLEKMDKLTEEQVKLTNTITSHAEREEEMIQKALNGFPDRDARGHHDWHKKRMDQENENKKFLLQLRNWAIFGLLGMVTTLVGAYIVAGFWAEVTKQVVSRSQ